MNVIAFDAAYSLYPRATFDFRCGLSLAQISPREAKALAKYATRGWAIHSTIWPHEEDTLQRLFKVYDLRRMGDRDSWVIPLDTTNITLRSPFTLSSPPFTEDPAIFSSWKLTESTSESGQYRMAYHFLSSTILKSKVYWNSQNFVGSPNQIVIRRLGLGGTLLFRASTRPTSSSLRTQGWKKANASLSQTVPSAGLLI